MRYQPYNTTLGGVGTFSFTLLSLLNLTFLLGRPQQAIGEAWPSLQVPSTAHQTSSAGYAGRTIADEDAASSRAGNEASFPQAPPSGAAAVAYPTLKQKRGHRRMFAPDPIVEEAITAEEYRRVMVKATLAGKGLIMMFYSAWCPHCFSYRKTFSQLAMDLHPRFHFGALNCMEDEGTMDICGSLGIFALPSIKLLVPASLHLQLPASEQHPKQNTSLEGNLHLEFPGMHDGGVLDSFDASRPEGFAIHSLALPSDDIYLAVQYAARKTRQKIEKNELQLTLGGDIAAFEHLRGIPCSSYRWGSEQMPELAAHDSSVVQQEKEDGRDVERNSVPMGGREAPTAVSARARLHDGIRGLQFILASWVFTRRERMSFAEQFALIDLLEIVRAVVPIRSVKRAAAHAIIHLQNSMQVLPDDLPLGELESLSEEHKRFSKYLEVYREIDDNLSSSKGLRTADWRKWIGSLAFGAEALPLPPLEEPRLKHCTTITCSVWMLMHVLAEGARELSAKDALIEQNPSLGCMIVPAFEVSHAIYNFLQRFFGCSACRKHFTLLFSRRSHGLDALSPPAGGALIRLPRTAGMASHNQAETGLSVRRGSDRSLLEEFRGQRRGAISAWTERHAEASKMDELKLWLWRFHNAVTVRTAADATLAFVKGNAGAVNYANCDTRWPPRVACTSCRNTPPPETGLVSIQLLLARDADKDILAMEEEFGDFNMADVLTFLRQSYWPDDIEDMNI
ncbi:hypothetical protein, conserved [Eimeria praecox]|uniref:Sulfhydryl oxidase n=1 Tax=Eimeria praecox TaxID=51316 RepID=U6H5P0_9EIME|nr:hypothetical protein, conserved [Eimeria praecox]